MMTGPNTVLVVDDQAPFRFAAKAVLRRLDGVRAGRRGASGAEAIALVDELHPDLVLMDINMPGMSGIEAARQIVAAHPEVVVFLCSTYDVGRPAAERGGQRGQRLRQQGAVRAEALRRLWQDRDSGVTFGST
jgi:CheY-like chemotaxis protein